ncbi:MAG: ankyrin repeat domain-containing protein [Saprospiraceae bacterium]|nr:ankyrin repeat domain-containing protein [Saprospiraceae bacterium]
MATQCNGRAQRDTFVHMTLHALLDNHYWPDGDDILRQMIAAGTDLNARSEDEAETPLHIATRRRRLSAVQILIEHGAEIDARNAHGKTAHAHAIRRGFTEISNWLAAQGADQTLNPADELAVAITRHDYAVARALIQKHPEAVRTGNPEEDRLLADIAGRNLVVPVALLINAGADLEAPGLDGGTPLHQSAWFGQPANARLLILAGAPLDIFDPMHHSSPLHWAVHGSRFSGAAEERQAAYVRLVEMLLDAGSALYYPDDNTDAYKERLLEDTSPQVRLILEQHFLIQ